MIREKVPKVQRPDQLPAWPVVLFLWGMPVFWLAGLLYFFSVIMVAIPMLAYLLRIPAVRITPGMLPFLAYVAWMIPCSIMVQQGSLIGYATRLVQALAAAVMFVYVVNARKSLQPRIILSGLVFVWFFVIVGGYLGMLFPEGRLNYTAGLLLPGGIASNDYVQDLVFPQFAEIQQPWGAEEPFVRPSAPFAYANGWGAAMVLLTPAAFAFASSRRSPLATGLVIVGAVAMIPPAVATTNRGLFLGLGLALFVGAIRLLFRGKISSFVAVVVGGAFAVIAMVRLGVVSAVAEREELGRSSEGRANLYLEAIQRTMESPILGFGAPRRSQFSEIMVGTQGALWAAMFCFGFVGLALFAVFLIGSVVRTWPAITTPELWLHVCVVAAALMSVFYGLDSQLPVLVIIIGLLLRERYVHRSEQWTSAVVENG